MELDFKKQKDRIAALSDAELVARLRDPSISSGDRMLIEAEIARRGLDRHGGLTSPPKHATRPRSKTVPNLISIVVVVGIFLSIVAGILDDMGIDLIEWLEDLFASRD